MWRRSRPGTIGGGRRAWGICCVCLFRVFGVSGFLCRGCVSVRACRPSSVACLAQTVLAIRSIQKSTARAWACVARGARGAGNQFDRRRSTGEDPREPPIGMGITKRRQLACQIPRPGALQLRQSGGVQGPSPSCNTSLCRGEKSRAPLSKDACISKGACMSKDACVSKGACVSKDACVVRVVAPEVHVDGTSHAEKRRASRDSWQVRLKQEHGGGLPVRVLVACLFPSFFFSAFSSSLFLRPK